MAKQFTNLAFNNIADFTQLGTFTTDASLLAGQKMQPEIPALFFGGGSAGVGRALRIKASGIFSTTGTPTWTFTNRLGTTVGDAYLSGTAVGVSAAITSASGVTNGMWEMELNLSCKTAGLGTNTVLNCWGSVWSNSFASPFRYPLLPTTPPTATWTATIDAALTYYHNLSVACSASSGSNVMTCKTLQMLSLN